MASRATSVPVTHEQLEDGTLYVGGDERERLLKTLRSCTFNRRRFSLRPEVDRESRKVIYAHKPLRSLTKATSPSRASAVPRRAFSVPLAFSDSVRENNLRQANDSHYPTASNGRHLDTSALERSDVNPMRIWTSSNTIAPPQRTGSSIPPGIQPITCQRNLSCSQPKHSPLLTQYPGDESENGLRPICNVGQQPSFHERPFPKGSDTGRTRWFRSSSAQQLLRPNEDLAAKVGDLYFHKNTRSGITYVWVLHPDEGWVRIEQGSDHPTMPKRRLRIRKDGDPSWVKARSLISMESRERHQRV